MSKEVVTKRGKPFRSVLAPYEREVQDFHAQGMSVRAIAAEMLVRHGVQISHNAVASFLRTHRKAKSFLEGLSETRKGELLKALKALWTHDSTAIEGNTLTLGDTMVVLEYKNRRINWFSRRLSDSAWARILAVYVLMLIGGVVGLRIGGVVGWGPSLFAFPLVTVLMGPFVIGVWIGMLLFGHGSGTLGPMFSLVLLGLQYVLLVVAFRRIVCKKKWMWGICLFAYPVAFAYVFPIVISST